MCERECGCIRTKRNETKQNNIVEECHSYVQFVSWQSHRLGMATRSPPSWRDGLVSYIQLACIATREKMMAQGSSQVSSQELHVRAPIPCIDGAHCPPSRFRLTYMRDPSTAGDRDLFSAVASRYPPPHPPPSQPPSRPVVRQRTVSRHSLEGPRISHASLTALRRLPSTHASSVPSPCPCLPGPSASQPAPILPVRRRPHASRNAHACLGCLADDSGR